MKRPNLYIIFATVLFLEFYYSTADAIFLDFQPAFQTVETDSVFTVDVVVSGLDSANEIVSAFDLDVTYDAGILDATGVTFSDLLGDPDPFVFETDSGFDLTTGRIDFWELSFLSDDELALLQPSRFSLATLSFQALAIGVTDLLFDPVAVPGIDVKGLSAGRLVLDVNTGHVSVTAQASDVPEPPIIFFCVLGLILSASRFR
ncbi:MAG: cohesin domain-containing protein [Gammaproteobacteria bacterium]